MTFTEADSLVFQTKDWSAIPRLARTVPFGYKIDENDPDLLQPVPLELEALELAKKHLRQFAYRDVANWLTDVTGRYISHMGLKKRLENERRRKSKVAFLEQLTKRVEEARAKIEKIETQSTGAHTPTRSVSGDSEQLSFTGF